MNSPIVNDRLNLAAIGRRCVAVIAILLFGVVLTGVVLTGDARATEQKATEQKTEQEDDGGSGERLSGEQIYAQQCLSCHGEGGRGGTDGYSDPLEGDASIGELVDVISGTMPEEDPDACVGKDAEAVAKYIYESFYSEAARLRNRPPTQSLSRLTGTQIQQSLADLYQHFFGSPYRMNEHGLSASYFNGGRWDKDKLKMERVDPVLDFDFGHESPVEGVEPEEFYVHWSGSLQVEHTGRYEIVVESTLSMNMRLGHHERKLIDNNVQSEGKTEFRRTLNLIGGRQYPIRIDFKQRKRKTEQPPAKFSLRWIPPGGVETVIPPENLIPSTVPSNFALQTKLPPDDRSYGYDRGTRVDRQWEDAVTSAAIEFGNAAADDLWPQYKRRHRKDSDENRGRLRSFLTELAELAFRSPLNEELKKLYIDDQVDAVEDDRLAILRTCLIILKSPRFLYPTLDQDAPESYRVANRLALVMFDSVPSDDWLLSRAEKGHFDLSRPDAVDQVREAAWKMAGDPRLHGKAMQMFFDWLDIDPASEISKDQDQFAGFDKSLTLDLRRSLQQTLTDVFWSESSDYRELFNRNWNWTNSRLGDFYGEGWIPSTESETIELVKSEPVDGKSFGVLTHPLVMSHLSYFDTTSPIHRGVFLIRRVLGRTLRPPNEAFTPLDAELHPDLTTRERVALQTGEAKCQVCHQKINSLGFPLENYDAVGRFRLEERGKPVDASGGYVTRTGDQVQFASPAELASFLANNEDAHRAFVERVFEHFAKQPINSYGTDVAERLVQDFRENGFHMRRLIVEIAVVVATQQLDSNQGNSHEST